MCFRLIHGEEFSFLANYNCNICDMISVVKFHSFWRVESLMWVLAIRINFCIHLIGDVVALLFLDERGRVNFGFTFILQLIRWMK